MTSRCDYCASTARSITGLYDANRVCCVVRLLLKEKKRERRKNMIDWYEKTKGEQFANEVRNEVLKRWK